jgi:xanthine/uracil/vitamin C permease (AzgA family)
MYAKTRPTAGSLTSRQKRVFAVAGLVVIVVLAGLGIWGALAHDSYGTSANGCVNVTLPSSTGGSTLHYCGAQAKAFCRRSFASADQVSLRARPQCVLAGLAASTPAASASS